MGLGRWFSRKIGSYSIDLHISEDIIKSMIHRVEGEKDIDFQMLDRFFLKHMKVYELTDPQYFEAFNEKWAEWKEKLFKHEFDKKREKYT